MTPGSRSFEYQPRVLQAGYAAGQFPPAELTRSKTPRSVVSINMLLGAKTPW